MKLCVDCRYFGANGVPICRHPRNISPVDGSVQEVTCSQMRDMGPCGHEGLLFISREPTYPDMPPSPVG